MSTIKERLSNYIRAAYPAVAIQTTEEQRAVGDAIAAARERTRDVYIWSAAKGMLHLPPDGAPKTIDNTEDLFGACAAAAKYERAVVILRDVHTWPFDRDPILCRTWRELLQEAPGRATTVIVIAPEYRPHPTCARLVTVLDYELPNAADLERIARAIAKSARREELEPTPEIIRALGGLSTTEAENALALSIVETEKYDPAVIYREKVQAVKRSGLLDLVEPDPRGLGAVGGLDGLKTWISKRRRAYSPEAVEYGLPPPKGILLVGIPGTGKSLCAKAVGTALGVPTIKLDVGALFQSLVGESEARTRDALHLAEAMAPCVLFLDEIDKGLSGTGTAGASGDSGVSRRVLGSILTWMQERPAARPVFVVATANQVDGLPPELLRKGRFDELFAVDLPQEDERVAIARIHLHKHKRDAEAYDLRALAAATDGYTGSEIEFTIVEALYHAFDDGGRALTSDDLLRAARAIVPLSVTAKDAIEAIRRWGDTRARPASRRAQDRLPTAIGHRQFD